MRCYIEGRYSQFYGIQITNDQNNKLFSLCVPLFPPPSTPIFSLSIRTSLSCRCHWPHLRQTHSPPHNTQTETPHCLLSRLPLTLPVSPILPGSGNSSASRNRGKPLPALCEMQFHAWDKHGEEEPHSIDISASGNDELRLASMSMSMSMSAPRSVIVPLWPVGGSAANAKA